jgi:uncharacterized protein
MPGGITFIDLFIFLLIALLAEILGTLGGFGSSLFFVSIAQFFFDMQTVLALTGLLHIFSNSSKIALFRKSIDWRLALSLGVPSVLLAIAGAYLTTMVNLEYSRLILGGFLIAFSIWFFLKPDFQLVPNLRNTLVGGGAAGFLAGFIGTGGAIRGLVLTSFHLEKSLFIGTSAAIDFGVDLTRTVVYLNHDFLSPGKIIYIPVLIVASFGGSYIGKIVVERISQETFKKILLGLVALMGIILIWGHFSGVA